MTFYFILAILVLFKYAAGAVPRVDPLVDSKVGLIRGQVATDGDYSMFLGIPYAKVDEANPFGPSVPYPAFEDTFSAFDDSAICPQVEEFNNTIVGTVDCLHLNVYVPTAASSRNRLPVLVWIYGGGFEIGFAGRYLYGPKFLVRHDIILVTLNYRLGPYGFMCLDTPAAPGNQGLKDQQLALRWVRDNIEAFGGDADKITIFGESAGSASVDFHLYQEQENLFQQAIMQSGTILNPWVVTNPGNEGPLKLAEHLGVNTDDVSEALSFLATVETKLVIAATIELGLTFRPCVENNFDDVVPFITEHPINLPVPNARFVKLFIGFNNDEGLAYYGNANAESLSQLDIVGDSLSEAFDFDSHTYEEMSEILRHFYFGDKDVSEETKRQVLDLFSDISFGHPTQRSLRKYYDNGANTIFSYLFSYAGERNFVKYNNKITIGGASHADEISYLFDVSYMKQIMSDEEQVVVDRMTSLWANFVKYGDPTPETTDLLPVKWVPATRDRWNYLNIDSELTMESRPFNDRMAFLDLFYKMNENFQKGINQNDA
ncbi:hypothetical protein MSG28_001357 [Choristoneura fumiferana]|uniref:Uncharacterized protein n=1 Tax=Choristoneura fumiferana TaxID=7141 RepID=A0ACC0KTL2_CHOFU|nr:hypothetical protein MSG28_001357 [Choristoneura fumiferana]